MTSTVACEAHAPCCPHPQARLLADTPLIANIDVDMLTSASLSASLRPSGGEVQSAGPAAGPAHDYVLGCTKEKNVYVIPAFETRSGSVGLCIFDPCNRGSASLTPAIGTLHP